MSRARRSRAAAPARSQGRTADIAFDVVGQRPELVLAARNQHDAVAALRELPRERGADARQCAGDERRGAAFWGWECHGAAIYKNRVDNAGLRYLHSREVSFPL